MVAAVVDLVVTEVVVLVLTVLGDEEHAAATTARATAHAANPARRRGIRRSGERDGFTLVGVRFVITLTTGRDPGSVHREQDLPPGSAMAGTRVCLHLFRCASPGDVLLQ